MAFLDRDGQPPRGVNLQANITKAVGDLYGLCRGLLADGDLSCTEVHALANWLARNHRMVGEWPISAIATKVARVLDDGKITTAEALELQDLLTAAVGGDTSQLTQSTRLPLEESPLPVEFAGRSFCFTGKFSMPTEKHAKLSPPSEAARFIRL